MTRPEREPRDWLVATLVSGVLHALVIWLGQAGLDARPRAPGAGVGPSGEFEVIALAPEAAEALVARRGSPRVAELAEAGGLGRATAADEAARSGRPAGAPGAAAGGGPRPPAPAGLGALRAAPRTPTALEGPLSAPDALPAPPSPAAGTLLDPFEGRPERTTDEQGAAEGSADPTGSEGLEQTDAGASDGDAAGGLNAGVSDDVVLAQVFPDYPPALASRDQTRGITSRTGRLGLAVEGERLATGGGAYPDRVWLIESTGDRELDRRALGALRRWRFDVEKLEARGMLGTPLWVDVEAAPGRR